MGKILFLFVFCAIVSMPIFVLAILLWGCNDGDRTRRVKRMKRLTN